MASVAQVGRRPLTREEHALVESVKTPMRKLAAKVARRCPSSDMADDLFQTAMAHVAYLTPDYRPEQGASFLTFVFWPVRDVLDESLKAELRDKAYAAAAERGLRVVMDVIELGDVVNETETQRRERMTTARYALAAAAILGFHSEPETPEERVLIEQERALSLQATEEGLKRVGAESAAMVRKCFWEEKSVAAAGRELGLGPDEARYRVQVALKVIGQLLPAGVGERT